MPQSSGATFHPLTRSISGSWSAVWFVSRLGQSRIIFGDINPQFPLSCPHLLGQWFLVLGSLMQGRQGRKADFLSGWVYSDWYAPNSEKIFRQKGYKTSFLLCNWQRDCLAIIIFQEPNYRCWDTCSSSSNLVISRRWKSILKNTKGMKKVEATL